jgi:TRAP-type C4-dicarboxylate transport system permease small subunit
MGSGDIKPAGAMARMLNAGQRSLEILLVLLTAVMVILVFFQVIFRYVFFLSLSWSEEISTFIFVWIVLIGSAVGIRRRWHLGINAVVLHLPKRTAMVLELVTNLIVICFFAFILVAGWEVALANMARRANTFDLPVGYIRMALPLMALFSIIFGVEWEFKLLRQYMKKSKGEEKEPSKIEGPTAPIEIS